MGEDAKTLAAHYLRGRWLSMRDDGVAVHRAHTLGSICVLEFCGVITPPIAELWQRRIETCPGHDDEGGRQWCAYCGDMPERGEHGWCPSAVTVPTR